MLQGGRRPRTPASHVVTSFSVLVPSNPKLFDGERLAYCEPHRAKMVDNRKRAHRQGVVAQAMGMKVKEWRLHEAKRLKTTVKAVKDGCEGTVQ